MVKFIVREIKAGRTPPAQGGKLVWVVSGQVVPDGDALGGQVQVQFAAAPGAMPPYTVDDVLTLDKLPAA